MKQRHTPGWLVRRLRELPEVQVTADESPGRIRVQPRGQGTTELDVLPRLDITVPAALALADELRHRQERAERPTLLAVDRFRPDARRQLTDAGLSWAERATGFLHVNAPGLYVHEDEGRRLPTHDSMPRGRGAAPSTPKRPTRLRGLSGRCAETLLLWWQDTGVHDRGALVTPTNLALWADVSTPMATHVLHRLEVMGALEAERGRQRTRGWRVQKPERMLDGWVDEEVVLPTVETLVYVWARSPRDLLQRLTRLQESIHVWAVGGVAAANLYAPTLTADPALTVWLTERVPAERAAVALEGKVVTEGGSITFRQIAKDPWALNRLVVGSDGTARRGTDVAGSDAEGAQEPSRLGWASLPVPGAERWPGLSLVSRPRAVVEAVRDGRGRAAEVAEAVRHSLALEPAAV